MNKVESKLEEYIKVMTHYIESDKSVVYNPDDFKEQVKMCKSHKQAIGYIKILCDENAKIEHLNKKLKEKLELNNIDIEEYHELKQIKENKINIKSEGFNIWDLTASVAQYKKECKAKYNK